MGAGVGGVTYTIRTGHALHTAAQCSGGLCCLPLESLQLNHCASVGRNYVGIRVFAEGGEHTTMYRHSV